MYLGVISIWQVSKTIGLDEITREERKKEFLGTKEIGKEELL